MIVKMFKNGIEIREFTRDGQCNWANLSNNEKIKSSELGVIEIECSECKKLSSIIYGVRLKKKEYICQSCIKSGERNGFYGKNHTDEFKLGFSIIQKERYSDPKNNPFYGKKHTEDTKAILKIKCARFGAENPFYGKKHTDEYKIASRRIIHGYT